jgi:tetratricopeptide (TPR) repeat protein
MTPQTSGSIRLFRVAGITVFLHWTWFVVAYWRISTAAVVSDNDDILGRYRLPVWYALEYLAIFGIVLLHEFGHAFACRQVGGTAERIVLWPLGGVAFVNPPPRPGPLLWSIAAGPLVNVLLVPVTFGLALAMHRSGLASAFPDVQALCVSLARLNLWLLIFNLVPVYPLDGGQILQALLWFVVGRAASLLVAGMIGLLGAGGLVVLAVYAQSVWLGIIALFVALQAAAGLHQAGLLFRLGPGLDRLEAALALHRSGAHDEAIDACTDALESLPDEYHAGLYLCRGMAHAAQGEHDEALTNFDDSLRLQETPGGYSSRGVSLVAQGRYDEAIDAFTQALRLDPGDAELYNQRGLAHLRAGRRAEGIRDFEQALRQAPNQAQAAVNLAILHQGEGEHEKAIALCRRALERDPRFTSALVVRGLSHARRGEYANAVRDYREAVRLDPRHANALNNLAWIEATCPDPKFRDGAKALEQATRACELTGWKVPAYLGTLAAACAEIGDFATALNWQNMALEDPEYCRNFGTLARECVQLYEVRKPYRDDGTRSGLRFQINIHTTPREGDGRTGPRG